MEAFGANKDKNKQSYAPYTGGDKPKKSSEMSGKVDLYEIRENCSHLHNYMIRMSDEGQVVYCRFGKEYITNLSKQANSISANPSLAPPMKQIATYLINIKKLIRDHNIESESKDFNRMQTKNGKIDRKREAPPL